MAVRLVPYTADPVKLSCDRVECASKQTLLLSSRHLAKLDRALASVSKDKHVRAYAYGADDKITVDATARLQQDPLVTETQWIPNDHEPQKETASDQKWANVSGS